MRNLLLAVGLLGVVGAWTGCGGSERPPAIDDGRSGQTGMIPGGNKGGSKMDGPVGGEGGGGGAGDEVVDPLAPLVTITSPFEVNDPNEPDVLSGAEVTVACKVTQPALTGSAKVDPTSIKLALLDADGAVVTEKTGTPTVNADEYSYTFSVTTAAAGRIGFRCTGQDTSKRVGTDRVATFLDKGPVITFLTPTKDSFVPLASVLAIRFTVDPAPLAEGDDGAAVDEVSLELGGTPIPLTDTETSPGVFELNVNLADPALFDPAPNGLFPVVVKASNVRMPTPVESIASQPIQVDGTAPTIQITSPVDKAVIGGNVVLTFKTNDALSGVDPATVVVSLNDVEEHFDPAADAWGNLNGTFTYQFDSRQVENSKVQITVNVRASDKVGNPAAVATEILYLDNEPPSVDLDPALIRTANATRVCSRAFDPVGPLSLDDLETAEAAGTLRALVWDNTNSLPEIPIKHIAGVNPAAVRVYLRHSADAALLVNTGGDGTCDDVNNVDDPAAIQLGPIARVGQPWGIVGEDGFQPTLASYECTNVLVPPDTIPNPGAEPQHVCLGASSDMYQVIEHTLTRDNIKEPAIFARGATMGQECTGIAWEFSTFLKDANGDLREGWVCFAARAVDRAGNVGVSRPLRICVDDPAEGGTPACALSSEAPPSCTDGCTPPPQWGGVVVRQL